MAEKKWTKEQLQAIYTKKTDTKDSCNILVNAAAGSGKTAVLVERIIKKLIPSDENPNPIDVDSLLVVTFTNAAAAEMKERVANAISEQIELAEAENDTLKLRALKRQASLIYNADMTTIDAFCIKMVREYFHLLGIDPNFGIADNAQVALLSEEVMEELFEACYEEKSEDFLLLANMFSDGRDDESLAEIIKSVYDFTRALPNPSEWLLEKSEMFLMKEKEKNPWVRALVSKKNRLCTEACDLYEKAIVYMADYTLKSYESIEKVISDNPPCDYNEMQLAWGNHYELVLNEYLKAKELLKADWDKSVKIFEGLIFEKLNKKLTIRDKDKEITDSDVKEPVKNWRDGAKKLLQKAASAMNMSLEEMSDGMRNNVYPAVSALVRMTERYGEFFAAKKEKKNVYEFSDLEHLCLKLFKENPDVCEELKAKYSEILMDEYQDTNGLQEEIFRHISRGDNLFMVGDMKQSIYRFRRSDPMIFKEKNDTYQLLENSDNRKIVLAMNFRSRKEVLDSVNAVFESIMSEAAGDINYDDEQKLNNGNKSYKDMNGQNCNGYISECYVLEAQTDADDEESIDKMEVEASFVARKIAELKKNGFMVRDGDEYRKIRNKDITILMSSHKYAADVYISALNKEGIDCFAESKGYFEKNEVRMILSLIKIIQNPYQDIPLLGVLRSPVGGFDDNELVKIRKEAKGYIFGALRAYSKKDDELALKCREFIKKLNRWRDYTKIMSCDKLIWTLYEETGIYAFVGALYGGDEAQANLRLLFERAKQYEKAGFKGLFHFSRYIDKLKNRAEDLSSAKMVGEGHDVVRIMTIHKSKGLEFPVVFLAGCGKKFFQKPVKIPLHNDFGFGIEEINPEKNYRISTIAREAVLSISARENISEEERKLYVALTRAKEKLFVTGVIGADRGKSVEARQKQWDEVIKSDGTIDPSDVHSAVGFIDWVAPVAKKNTDVWKYEFVPYKPYFADAFDEEEEVKQREKIKISEFKYPYENLETVPTKISVTALKKADGDLSIFKADAQMAKGPEFLEEEKKLSGAEKGTALHFAMQKLVPEKDMTAEYIEECITGLFVAGEITEAERDAIDAEKILKFYQSDLGKRIIGSDTVVREAPFETDIPLSLFAGYEKSEEKILLQGIIDCYFEEDGEIVLLDYKSDYYKTTSEITEKYKSQLDWYAYALEKITGKKVKEKYICMFYGNDIEQIN